jgi:hypothetical protein
LPGPNLRPTQKRPLLLLVATHRQKGERQERQLLPGPNLRPTPKRPLLFCSTCYSTRSRSKARDAKAKGGDAKATEGDASFVLFL